MADDHDPNNTSEVSDQPDVAPAKEDAETAATRKELRHTAISEQPVQDLAVGDDSSSSSNNTPPRSKTPDDAQNDTLMDQVGSPKKKRAHDEVEADHKDDLANISPNHNASPPPGGRTTRSEPEKKRPRDEGSVSGQGEGKDDDMDATQDGDTKEGAKPKPVVATEKPAAITKALLEKNGQIVTSDDAFKKSGLSALSNVVSPFLTADVPALSAFSSNASTASPFSVPAGVKSVFGSALAKPGPPSHTPLATLSSSSMQSPFGVTANGSTASVFGSTTSTFSSGSGSGAVKLSSFATPGQSSLNKENHKPARDFGAPESDGEDDTGKDGSDRDDDKEEANSSMEKEGSQPPVDDKKKPKLQKVQVNDGEAGEAILLSVRAKIYALDRAANTWKERGTGYLKINSPVACVEMDDKGIPIPGSFDASTLENGDTAGAKGPRLIMRQDHTHRVILNAAIGPSIKFNKTDSLKAAHLIFQAFEDNGMTTLQLKMSTVNAKDLLKEFDSIVRELVA